MRLTNVVLAILVIFISYHENDAGHQFDTSPTDLVSIFQGIWEKTDIFPDNGNASWRVTIKSVETGLCVDAPVSRNVLVIQWPCHGQDHQLIYLDHVGEGYIALRINSEYCIGTAFEDYSPAFLTTGPNWCQNSHSHHWSIQRNSPKNETYVKFVNRETGKYLSSNKGSSIVGPVTCECEDIHQKFEICDQQATKCYP